MKDTSLAGEDDCASDVTTNPPAAIVRVLKITNQKGLHARASAKFVQTVEKFDADVRVSRGGETVGGTSIMGLMMLAAGLGTEITIAASGNERVEVLTALETLVNGRFGEEE
jgi:phosphocarrier protein